MFFVFKFYTFVSILFHPQSRFFPNEWLSDMNSKLVTVRSGWRFCEASEQYILEAPIINEWLLKHPSFNSSIICAIFSAHFVTPHHGVTKRSFMVHHTTFRTTCVMPSWNIAPVVRNIIVNMMFWWNGMMVYTSHSLLIRLFWLKSNYKIYFLYPRLKMLAL